MRAIVTDGQLGQLAVKQQELFQRAKKGIYASFDELLGAVQMVIEGRPPLIPTLATENMFAKWRTFQIGSRDRDHFLARVAKGHETRLFASELDTFPVALDEESMDTVILTPADFGYEHMPDVKELFSPRRLDTWSRLNVHYLGGCYIELLPAQAGPYILGQYEDQPENQVLFIAMERISNSSHVPRIFSITRFADGQRLLFATNAPPFTKWGLHSRIIFRLRRIV